MLTLLALMAAAQISPPDEAVTREIYAAIWNDLQTNAMIGNGNWIASLWYNAGRGSTETPDLHIRDLSCRTRANGYRCSFTLLRDGGVATPFGEEAPDRLDCNAEFFHNIGGSGGWSIKHLPPLRGGGHTRTTMRCERATTAR
jgi:hypothetical protein